MAISPLFKSLDVWPSHGMRTALVSWEVDPAILSGSFYVYRSPDGMGEWRLLNDTAVNGLSFLDESFHVSDRSRVPHYRVACEMEHLIYESAVIGLFERTTRRDMCFANKVREEELRRMRGGNGIQVFYYPAKLGGLPCGFVDKETEAHLGHGCAGTDRDCYGTGLVGGYRKPMAVWAELYDRAPQSGSNSGDGRGQTDYQGATVRLLAPFIPQVGDLVVFPASDDRFLVGEETKVHKIKGIVPVMSDAKLELLPRNHDAYRLQRPEGVLP
jgi:hypothetical protein